MEESGIIDMGDQTTKFCVSFVCVNVASVGVKRFVSAWNSHPIAGIIYGMKIVATLSITKVRN